MTATTDPCRTLSDGLRNEDGGESWPVAIWRPGRIGNDCYRHEVTVEQFLGMPGNFGGTWLIDGGWGGPPGPVRVDWLDSESRWQCRGYSAECRDPVLPDPVKPDRANYELHIPSARVEELTIPFGGARQAVQIAFAALDTEKTCLIALCNDGSLWCLQACSPEWAELPAIPQS
jgi:hypothetical protein